jgi:hypothetical protein
MRHYFFGLALVIALHQAAGAAGNSTNSSASPEPAAEISSSQANTMKIRLRIKDAVLTATLRRSKTAQDFVSLLPITLTLNDLFRREKYGRLPRELSEGGDRTHSYEVGQVVYWSPGPDVAIFYRHDRQSIPDPGIIVVGKLDSGVEALNVDGPVKVTIELANQSSSQTEEAGETSNPLPAAAPTLEDLRTVAGWPNVFSAIPIVKSVFEKRPK